MRSDACASAPPVGAATPETLIHATGLPWISPPMVQSRRFLNEPGSAPAYSGVEISTASAPATSARSSTTGAGSTAPSASSSGLKCGRRAIAPKRLAVTPAGGAAAMLLSSAVFVEPARRLPDSSSSARVVGGGIDPSSSTAGTGSDCHPAVRWQAGRSSRSSCAAWP